MLGRVLLALLIVCPVSCSTEEVSTATTSAVALPTTGAPAETPETTQLVTSTTDLPTPNGVDPDSPCLQRAVFGDPAESEYLLPFAVGEEYWISQSYCYSEGGHSNQLAYDFDMPVGASVLAAREGVVKEVKEDSPDTGRGRGLHNYVFIEHRDGTVAFYAHLKQDGVEVEPGDWVQAGEFIAFAGNSGLTGGPHLHFGVYQDWRPREGKDVPVNFRNASGQHDARSGLAIWRLFEALPVD
ncbi:MAG: M23 family metallopeptidase [Acidimicrobiia bacterium]|nr:M23 family metallopeptidase [Acidimicrobiia bacterium]